MSLRSGTTSSSSSSNVGGGGNLKHSTSTPNAYTTTAPANAAARPFSGAAKPMTSTSTSSTASLRAAVQQAVPSYIAPTATSQYPQQVPMASFAVPVRTGPISPLPLPSQQKQQQQQQREHLGGRVGVSSSSSPPTPSSLSTSDSHAAGHVSRGATATTSTAAVAVRDDRPARKQSQHLAPSASFHAATTFTNATGTSITPATTTAATPFTTQEASGALKTPGFNASGARDALGSSVAAASAAVAAAASATVSMPPPPPPPHTSAVMAADDDEEAAIAAAAARAKEVQRQQILAHANDLLTFCAISNTVTSIRQCTSSFFVLLYQRLFDCTIPGIDRSPNTAEKRRHNVTLVLEQLRQHPYSLSDIEAEEVVRLNEDHISRLIMVFVQVAEDMRRQQQQQLQQESPPPQQQQQQLGVMQHSQLPSSEAPLVSSADVAVQGGHGFMVGREGAHAVDGLGVVHSSSGGAYVPAGYTVAEVMQNTAGPHNTNINIHHHNSSGMDRSGQYPYVNPAVNAALAAGHHYKHGVNDFYVAPAPPLNGGALEASTTAAAAVLLQQHHHQQQMQQFQQQQQQFNNYNNSYNNNNVYPYPAAGNGGGAVAVAPYEGDESPSSVSYYLDSSAIPTDELLAEWYRNLVYPAPHTPKSDTSALLRSTTTPVSELHYSHHGRGGAPAAAAAAAAAHNTYTDHDATGLTDASYEEDADAYQSAVEYGRTPPGRVTRPDRATVPPTAPGVRPGFSPASSSAAAAAAPHPRVGSPQRQHSQKQKEPQKQTHQHPGRKTSPGGRATPSRKLAGGNGNTAAGDAAERSRKLSSLHASRTPLPTRDIVQRCQRLEETLDAQEGRHRQAFVGDETSLRRAADTPAGLTAEERISSRLHRGLPVQVDESTRRDATHIEDSERRREVRDGTPRHRDTAEEDDVPALPNSSAPAAPVAPSQQRQQQQQHKQSSAGQHVEARQTSQHVNYHYQQQVQQQQQQMPARPSAPHHRLAAEPPLTLQERDFLLRRPQQHRDAALRDRKIERLRAARYLGDMQQLLRRRMRHEYDAQMSAMRDSLKATLRTSRAEKMDLMRRVRDENERYRAAYATLMEAAANEAQVPARVMSRHTAQLADYYATSLQHSQTMCDALKRETDRRTRQELLQYAEEVSAWQQHFLL